MADKPPEEGYISVVDEEPEIFELLKWDHSQTQKASVPHNVEKAKPEKVSKPKEDIDPFELPDATFIETYRLTKELTHNLISELKPVMPDSTKSIDFSVESKVMAALSFYATGKYQKSFRGKTDPNITQYFVSTAVLQVTEAMNHPTIVKKYIHFPHLKNERDIVKTRFYLRYGIPNVVGAVDCSHVPIARPSDDQKTHFNKSYHSKKVQIISDSDHNIMSVEARCGGSYSHDAILNRHAVKVDLESLNNAGENCWLVGGPHYSQKLYLMTPIPKVTKKSPDSPEKYYTTTHAQVHTVVLDTIQQLKSRWKCLQATCNKQFDTKTVSMLITACCILHNICNRNELPEVHMTQTEERLEAMKQKVANSPISRKQVEDPKGVETRARLVERLWNERRVVPASAKKRMSKKDRLLEGYQTQNQSQSHNQVHSHSTHHEHQQPQHHQIYPIHQGSHQMATIQPIPNPSHHEDLSKRPRIVINSNPAYGLGVTSGWGHFPQH